ncbi:hypothetical protein ACOSP7_024225 [Xanthoceras sorbifolium]
MPLVVIPIAEKTSSSESVRAEQVLIGADRSYYFCDPREIPNTYAFGGTRPTVGVFGLEVAFSPKEAIDFIFVNARSFIRCTEGVGLGKLSNDDRIRLAAFHTWTAFTSLQSQEVRLLREHLKDLECTLVIQKDLNTSNQIKLENACVEIITLKLENERLRRKAKAIEASIEDLKEATTKGAKAVEYKLRAEQARGIIYRLKKEFEPHDRPVVEIIRIYGRDRAGVYERIHGD